jgi:RNA polymerase primary sigma factor
MCRMGRFRIAQVGELARQMQFTPSDKRGRQLTAAEELLLQLEPARAYPFAFVVFRITGYHPKQATDALSNPLLTGMALQHDLGLLIEQVSDSIQLRVSELEEPVLTIAQVVRQFNASDKSLQRWRRRGLAARRFIFPDGKKRVAFLASSVERFFSLHRDGMARTANFSPITADERTRIIHWAGRLAAAGVWKDELVRRIGRRMNRSPLMVAYVLEQNTMILAALAPPPTAEQRDVIVDGFAGGRTITELARDFALPRWAVYRVLLNYRLKRLSRTRVRFIDDPLYHQPDARRAIEAIFKAAEKAAPPAPRTAEEPGLPRDLPPYLKSLCDHPLLTAVKERALFLKMHLHKFQFVTLRRKLEARAVKWKDVNNLETHLRLAQQTKNQIVASNLRLVISVARKHVRENSNLMDLASDGNVALMRSADSYDFHRGNRFSTYATLALMKEFARGIPRFNRRKSLPLEGDVADARGVGERSRFDHRDEIKQLLSNLGEREQQVLRAHYGVTDENGQAPASLDEITQQLRLSKQRIRQIEKAALAKLRAAAEETSTNYE